MTPQLEVTSGNIEFKNVSFKYNNSEESVLRSINLEIIGGKMNALVGHSGAGKSTILNLIPKFFNCSDGNILIDGQSIYDLSFLFLREKISMIVKIQLYLMILFEIILHMANLRQLMKKFSKLLKILLQVIL